MPSRDVTFTRSGAFWSLAISLVLLSLLIGCNISREEDKKGPLRAGCFKCHPERLTSSSVHRTHMQMGLRCSQCHKSKKPAHGTLIGTTCQNCHNIKNFAIGTGKRQVWFNHEKHMERFSCKRCHSGIFPMKRQTLRITMAEIKKGLYCGVCHNGRVAFSYQRCEGCHN